MTLRLAATATVGEVAFGGVGSLRFGFFPSESSAARLPQRHVSSVRRPKSVRQCSLTTPFFASSGRCMRGSFPVRRLWVRRLATEASTSQASEGHEGGSTEGAPEKQTPYYFNQEALGDAEEEVLSPQEKAEKEQLVKLLAKKLAGPLADENGNVPTGDDRPIAIEVDGPSHFYSNSCKYTAYTKLKHRLLTRMGYKVVHVPYFEWRRLRGQREREEYMRRKLLEEPTEWLDPEDEAFYTQRINLLRRQYEEEERLRVQSQGAASGSDSQAAPSSSAESPKEASPTKPPSSSPRHSSKRLNSSPPASSQEKQAAASAPQRQSSKARRKQPPTNSTNEESDKSNEASAPGKGETPVAKTSAAVSA